MYKSCKYSILKVTEEKYNIIKNIISVLIGGILFLFTA